MKDYNKRKWRKNTGLAPNLKPATQLPSVANPQIQVPMQTTANAEDAVLVASIAAQMIPRIELPQGWQNMTRRELLSELQMPSSAELDPLEPYDTMIPFYCVAEVFVARARVLLNTARGVKRPDEKEPSSNDELMARYGDTSKENIERVSKKIRKRFKSDNDSITPTALISLAIRGLQPKATQKMVSLFLANNPGIMRKNITANKTGMWALSKAYIHAQTAWEKQKERIRTDVLSQSGRRGAAKAIANRGTEINTTESKNLDRAFKAIKNRPRKRG